MSGAAGAAGCLWLHTVMQPGCQQCVQSAGLLLHLSARGPLQPAGVTFTVGLCISRRQGPPSALVATTPWLLLTALIHSVHRAVHCTAASCSVPCSQPSLTTPRLTHHPPSIICRRKLSSCENPAAANAHVIAKDDIVRIQLQHCKLVSYSRSQDGRSWTAAYSPKVSLLPVCDGRGSGRSIPRGWLVLGCRHHPGLAWLHLACQQHQWHACML